MRQAYRKRHLKQHHKSTHIRRNCYFRTYQQDISAPLSPIADFVTLDIMMQSLAKRQTK